MSSMTMADLFCALANAHPHRLAVVSGNRRLTYRQLFEQAEHAASVLTSRHVMPEQRVGVALRDNLDTLVSMLGLWLLNAVPTPLDFRSRGEQRSAAVADFDLSFVVEDRSSGAVGFASIAWDEEFRSLPDTGPRPLPERSGAAAPALISLTSGTTGSPVGVVFAHGELIARARSFGDETPNYPHGGKLLMPYPLAFSASRSHVFGMLVTGGTVCFHPPIFGASELIEQVNALDIDLLFAVPATVSAMLAVERQQPGFAMPRLAVLYSGAAGMSPSEKLRAAERLSPGFLHCFATSLAGTCAALAGNDLRERSDSDGRIYPTVLCQAVDAEGRVVAPGEVGELRVRSTSMVSTLVGRERVGSDRVRDGWAYSGDLVRISDDGFLTVVGRTSDMIIRSGTNVYPAEVENVLCRVPGVSEAALVGIPDPEAGEELAAFVVGDGTVTEATLVAFCRTHLAPDKRPRVFRIVDALPRSDNGKILKRELRDLLANGSANSVKE